MIFYQYHHHGTRLTVNITALGIENVEYVALKNALINYSYPTA